MSGDALAEKVVKVMSRADVGKNKKVNEVREIFDEAGVSGYVVLSDQSLPFARRVLSAAASYGGNLDYYVAIFIIERTACMIRKDGFFEDLKASLSCYKDSNAGEELIPEEVRAAIREHRYDCAVEKMIASCDYASLYALIERICANGAYMLPLRYLYAIIGRNFKEWFVGGAWLIRKLSEHIAPSMEELDEYRDRGNRRTRLYFDLDEMD